MYETLISLIFEFIFALLLIKTTLTCIVCATMIALSFNQPKCNSIHLNRLLFIDIYYINWLQQMPLPFNCQINFSFVPASKKSDLYSKELLCVYIVIVKFWRSAKKCRAVCDRFVSISVSASPGYSSIYINKLLRVLFIHTKFI